MNTGNRTHFTFALVKQGPRFAMDAFKVQYLQCATDYEVQLYVQTPSPLVLSDLLNQLGLLSVFGEQSASYFHGVVSACRSLGETPDKQQFAYFILLISPISLLRLHQDNRVFLKMSVVEVVTQVLQKILLLNGHFRFDLSQVYPKRECIIQYDESDYDFLWRLLTFWGLFFTWVQTEQDYQLIILDNVQRCEAYFMPLQLRYQPLSGTVRAQEAVYFTQQTLTAVSKNVLLRDYNPKQPSLQLEFGEGEQGEDRYGEQIVDQREGEILLRARQEALVWQRETILLKTDCAQIQVGQRISLTDHPFKSFNRDYRVIAIEHEGEQSDGKIYGYNAQRNSLSSHRPAICNNLFAICPANAEEKISVKSKLNYSNRLLCIPANMPFRAYLPLQKKYHSFMTAKIESADASSYAAIDQDGNYRIRFPFDLSATPAGQGSPSLRLAQPYTGQNFGFHFPLKTGTEVLVNFENGDIDRPVLLGVLPNPETPSPVTSANPTQNIIKTLASNTLLMEDTAGSARTQLATHQQLHELLLDATAGAHQIRLATTQGKMELQVQKNFITQTDSNYAQYIGNDHEVIIANDYQVKTTKGDIHLQAGRDLKFTANNDVNLQTHQGNIALQSGNNAIFDVAQNAVLKTIQGNINIFSASGDFALKANQSLLISALGKGDITIAQAGGMIKFQADGSIHVQGKIINVISKQNNLIGQEVHMGGQGQAAPSPQPLNPTGMKLIYYYNNGTDQGVAITDASCGGHYPVSEPDNNNKSKDTFPLIIPVSDNTGSAIVANIPAASHVNIAQFAAPFHHQSNPAGLGIIEINQKKQSPWQKVQIQLPSNPTADPKNPDAAHTFNIKAIHQPILKDYSNYVKGQEKQTPLLTEEEVNYFRNNGNNAMVFVHGYNVAPGNFGYLIENIKIENIQGPHGAPMQLITARLSNLLSTLCCTWDELRQQFPQLPVDPSVINEEDPDILLNGTEAHNFLLHMEYNLNCAASGSYPFAWEQHGLDYIRIIGIHWPGDVGELGYLDAEQPAYQSGLALVPLLQQLHQAGIAINLLAHSLGCRVALTAMQQLGQQGINNVVDHLFLWEAAVPNNALSPLLAAKPQQNMFPCAHKAAQHITVFFSANDEVLADAYRAAQGERITKTPLTTDKLILLIMHSLRANPALGSVGVDDLTKGTLGAQLKNVDQKDLLEGHSAMKIPTEALFDGIYKKWIIGDQGTKKFGKYKFS